MRCLGDVVVTRLEQWARVALAAACLLALGPMPARAEVECSDDDYTISPDVYQRVFDEVAEHYLDQSGRAALKKLYDSGIATSPSKLNALLKNLPDVMTTLEGIDALAVRDYKKVMELGVRKAVEVALESEGVPFVAGLMMTFDVAKASINELEHQDCLLQVDVGYYNFLDDPKLSGKAARTTDTVSYYIQNYVRGPGKDPFGNPKEFNRRILQCYINETYPEKEKFSVDVPTWNPFGAVAQVVNVLGPDKHLRTTVMIMLKDFRKRRELEALAKEGETYANSPEFKMLKETLPLLGNYPLLADKICEEYQKMAAAQKNPVTAGVAAGMTASIGGTTTPSPIAAQPDPFSGMAAAGATGATRSTGPATGGPGKVKAEVIGKATTADGSRGFLECRWKVRLTGSGGSTVTLTKARRKFVCGGRPDLSDTAIRDIAINVTVPARGSVEIPDSLNFTGSAVTAKAVKDNGGLIFESLTYIGKDAAGNEVTVPIGNVGCP